MTPWQWIKFSPWSRVSGSYLPNSVSFAFNPPIPSFDLSALYLVTLATSELKEFLAQAKGGAIRIMKIVIRNGKHETSLIFKGIWHHLTFSWLVLNPENVLVCRGVGARVIQRACTQLGQRLRPVPASSAHASGPFLHPLSSGLPERPGIRVDLHRMVTWPITSMSSRCWSSTCHGWTASFKFSHSVHCKVIVNLEWDKLFKIIAINWITILSGLKLSLFLLSYCTIQGPI